MNGERENCLPVPLGEGDRKPERGKDKALPGAMLSATQRQVAQTAVEEGVGVTEAARRCHVPPRTARYWAQVNADFRRYLDYLTHTGLAESDRIIRSKVARKGPALMDKAISLAEGEKPGHPYQDRALSMVLERASPTKREPGGELDIKLPTDKGDILIIWKGTARHPWDAGHEAEEQGDAPTDA